MEIHRDFYLDKLIKRKNNEYGILTVNIYDFLLDSECLENNRI